MVKMKKVWATGLLCLPLILFGQSMMENLSTESELEKEMTIAELNREQLAGFNERATQKLNDFADVLTILGDENLEMEIRKEVVQTTLGNFKNKEVVIEWYGMESADKMEISVDSFLEKTVEILDGNRIQFLKINGVPPYDCLFPKCEWKLNFLINQNMDDGLSKSIPAIMNVSLEKREKYFGENKRQIWQVFLGEIKTGDNKP